VRTSPRRAWHGTYCPYHPLVLPPAPVDNCASLEFPRRDPVANCSRSRTYRRIPRVTEPYEDAGTWEPAVADSGAVESEPDLRTPNVARMYDYYLGGKNNFEVDRETAEAKLQEVGVI